LIELKNPKEYQDTMRVLVLHDSKTDEKNIKSEKFETKKSNLSQNSSHGNANDPRDTTRSNYR